MFLVRPLVLALTLFLVPLARAARFDEMTPLRSLLAHFQKNYADANVDYPILLLDRDDLDWRIARAGGFGEKALDRRVQVLRDYLREKTGVTIAEGDAVALEHYVTTRKDSAYALPLFTDALRATVSGTAASGAGASGTVKKHRVCVVFPADASSNQRLEHERILGLQVPGVYDHGFGQLRVKMGYAELRLFSLVHELGHCFDRWYLPGNAPSGEDPYLTHQAEAFAETFAALVLAREGWSALAETRGALRTLYARKMGEFLAKNSGLGEANARPDIMYGGLMYHLGPTLSAVARDIVARPPAPAAALGDLVARAKEIVARSLLPRASFRAVGASYAQGRAAVFELFRKLAQESPASFATTYHDLRAFYETTDPALEKAFDSTRKDHLSQTPLSALDPAALCGLFRAPDRTGLQDRMDGWRRELARGLDVPAKQRQRALELRALPARLQALCPPVPLERANSL